MRPIVGRRGELEATRAFLGTLATRPSHLVLEGPAGIGKSAIWSAAVAMAAEAPITLLVTRPATAEAGLAWSGLNDLLSPILAPSVLDALPEPQRRSLEIALARREPGTGPLDDLSVRLAAIAILEAALSERPVVLAVDDLQWLDAPTTGVIGFALRRLADRQIGLLATVRSAEPDPLAKRAAAPAAEPGREVVDAVRGTATTVPVGPLDDASLREVIRAAATRAITRAALDEIAGTSGGNPLYAIELARSSDVRPAGGLKSVVNARVRALPAGAQHLISVVATVGPIAWEEARQLTADALGEEDLEAAVGDGLLVSRDGLVSFSHPLLASVAFDGTSEPRRQRLHRAFAGLWPDREDAPRHLAAGTTQPDTEIAARVDAGADRARRRGAPAVAAALYGEAARLTPAADRDGLARRQIEAALAHVAAGSASTARDLLEQVASDPDGPRRAEALHRLAGVVWAADGDRAGMNAFYRALPAAAGEPAIEGDIHDSLAWLTCWLGDMPRAYEHVKIARDLAERVGDPGLLSRVFDKYAQIEFQIAKGPGLGASAKAVEYEIAAGAVGDAAQNEAVILLWSDRLDEARERLLAYLRHAEATGDERFRIDVLSSLGALETRTGEWSRARAYQRESLDAATAAGLASGPQRRGLALLDALSGHPDGTMALVNEALPVMREQGAAWAVIRLLGMAGVAHLSAGDIETAATELDEAITVCTRVGVREPGIFRVAADAVEALVATGRLDRAEEVLSRFEAESREVGRRWGLATAARGRALLAAARGQIDAALEAARESVALTSALGQPFEHARSLLVAGTIERRAGHRRDAREHLSGAQAAFKRLGADSWAERAAAELGRISGRTSAGNELTPTELRVAELVREGLTNQEVAARMFVTVRTVESNLTRIYDKLGVRSRTEMVRRLAEDAEPVRAGG